MKVLLLYEYPPLPAGLSTQGALLHRGLSEMGIEVQAAHLEADHEKEWYYRWFRPDIAVGVGFWGYAPHIILHPARHGVQPVPWLVANGYIGNYRDELDALPLILLTSNWVKQVYIRDGIRPDNLEVLPVGCDTDLFIPREPDDPSTRIVRESLGIRPDELMLLTIGGDAASKGAQEVMRALARIGNQAPPWRYVCKVWPQERTTLQNRTDFQLAQELGILDRVVYVTSTMSRNYMPSLIGACDIYVGPSRLEGFGMPHVEANACGKPVVAIDAMAFRDTMVHGETAFLAGVAQENCITETILGENAGCNVGQRVVFETPRTVDYRASVEDLATMLACLMQDASLRRRMGEAGRARVVARFDYRVVTRRFAELVAGKVPGTSAPAYATQSATGVGVLT